MKHEAEFARATPSRSSLYSLWTPTNDTSTTASHYQEFLPDRAPAERLDALLKGMSPKKGGVEQVPTPRSHARCGPPKDPNLRPLSKQQSLLLKIPCRRRDTMPSCNLSVRPDLCGKTHSTAQLMAASSSAGSKPDVKTMIDLYRSYYRAATRPVVATEARTVTAGSPRLERRSWSGPGTLVMELRHVDRSKKGPVVRDYIIERSVKIPKKVVKEEVFERTVVVREKRIVEEIIEETQIRLEREVEVRTPVIKEITIEVPEYQIVERETEVPYRVHVERDSNMSCELDEKVKVVRRPVPVENVSEIELFLPRIRPVVKNVDLPIYVPRFVDFPLAAEFFEEAFLDEVDRMRLELNKILTADRQTPLWVVDDVAASIHNLVSQLHSPDAQSCPGAPWYASAPQPLENSLPLSPESMQKAQKNFMNWWMSNQIPLDGKFASNDGSNFSSSFSSIIGENVSLIINSERSREGEEDEDLAGDEECSANDSDDGLHITSFSRRVRNSGDATHTQQEEEVLDWTP